ncbi:MAG: hypothetical protein GX936_06180 [Clostridiales bacterium]|nr:hypothetical protein [Clostridiales bacterium]
MFNTNGTVGALYAVESAVRKVMRTGRCGGTVKTVPSWAGVKERAAVRSGIAPYEIVRLFYCGVTRDKPNHQSPYG